MGALPLDENQPRSAVEAFFRAGHDLLHMPR
jgi:hypothetical protein